MKVPLRILFWPSREILCWDQGGPLPQSSERWSSSPLCPNFSPLPPAAAVPSVGGTSTANIHQEAALGAASCWMLRIEMNQGRRRAAFQAGDSMSKERMGDSLVCGGS